MKKVKILSIISLTTFLICCFLFPVNALTSKIQGYAVYRDGNGINFDWHAGLMSRYDLCYDNSIIHVAKQDGYLIEKCSKEEFVGELEFFGLYRPISYSSLTEDQKNRMAYNIKYMAERLMAANIEELGYNLIFQAWYSNDTIADGKVNVSELTSLRCDGLVEYCYEFYGCSVYGDNISTFDSSIRNNHRYPNITPQKQSKYYLQNCLGDIDCSGIVTVSDAQSVLAFAVHNDTPEEYEFFLADVNGDNSVSVADARYVLRYATNLISIFPADPLNDS